MSAHESSAAARAAGIAERDGAGFADAGALAALAARIGALEPQRLLRFAIEDLFAGKIALETMPLVPVDFA